MFLHRLKGMSNEQQPPMRERSRSRDDEQLPSGYEEGQFSDEPLRERSRSRDDHQRETQNENTQDPSSSQLMPRERSRSRDTEDRRRVYFGPKKEELSPNKEKLEIKKEEEDQAEHSKIYTDDEEIKSESSEENSVVKRIKQELKKEEVIGCK